MTCCLVSLCFIFSLKVIQLIKKKLKADLLCIKKEFVHVILVVGNRITGAIAGGVAAGAALLFAVPAIALAWWRRKKPQDHFFDVPG